MRKDVIHLRKEEVHLVEEMDLLRGSLRSGTEIGFEWKEFSYRKGGYKHVHRLNQQWNTTSTSIEMAQEMAIANADKDVEP